MKGDRKILRKVDQLLLWCEFKPFLFKVKMKTRSYYVNYGLRF